MAVRDESRALWVREALDRYEGPLIRHALRFTGDLDRARDVVQDVFLHLWQADRGRVDGHLAGWLYTVCRNRALDVAGKERRTVPLTERNEAAELGFLEPDAVAERHEADNHVAAAIRTLSENQQEVIRLKFQDAMSYKEISEVTGLSVSNVGYLLHTAIKRIRQRLVSATDLMDEA